jgi:hypothetical protein
MSHSPHLPDDTLPLFANPQGSHPTWSHRHVYCNDHEPRGTLALEPTPAGEPTGGNASYGAALGPVRQTPQANSSLRDRYWTAQAVLSAERGSRGDRQTAIR